MEQGVTLAFSLHQGSPSPNNRAPGLARLAATWSSVAPATGTGHHPPCSYGAGWQLCPWYWGKGASHPVASVPLTLDTGTYRLSKHNPPQQKLWKPHTPCVGGGSRKPTHSPHTCGGPLSPQSCSVSGPQSTSRDWGLRCPTAPVKRVPGAQEVGRLGGGEGEGTERRDRPTDRDWKLWQVRLSDPGCPVSHQEPDTSRLRKRGERTRGSRQGVEARLPATHPAVSDTPPIGQSSPGPQPEQRPGGPPQSTSRVSRPHLTPAATVGSPLVPPTNARPRYAPGPWPRPRRHSPRRAG